MYSVENTMYFSLKKSEKLAMKLVILMNFPNLQEVNQIFKMVASFGLLELRLKIFELLHLLFLY